MHKQGIIPCVVLLALMSGLIGCGLNDADGIARTGQIKGRALNCFGEPEGSVQVTATPIADSLNWGSTLVREMTILPMGESAVTAQGR